MKSSVRLVLATFICLSGVAVLTSVFLANLGFFKESPPSISRSKKSLTNDKENNSEWGDKFPPIFSVLKSAPIRLQESNIGIPVGDALEPPLCPPPPVTRSQGICFLSKCTTNMDCPRGRACCFNGCVRACTSPLDQPAAFDWIEDSSYVLPILGPDFGPSNSQFMPILIPQQPTNYAAAEGGEELVHLPGGCLVSASQHEKLKEFVKASSIKECRCLEGEVLCDVIKVRT